MKKLLICSLFLMFISCDSPFDKQYLLYRDFLSDITLYNPVVLHNAVMHDKIKAIHIGIPGDTLIRNYMVFNENGDLLSINRSQHKPEESRFMDKFFYDKKNRLYKIIPSGDYYSFWHPDSLIVSWNKFTPEHILVFRNDVREGEISLNFTQNFCHFVQYNPDTTIQCVDLFEDFYFEDEKIMYEVHQRHNHADFTTYTYKNNDLVKEFRPYDDTYEITEFDSLCRPVK